jgi:tetratricopeptide (TPR) repeat protein
MLTLRAVLAAALCWAGVSAYAQTSVDAVGGYLGPSPTISRSYLDGVSGSGRDDWSRCQGGGDVTPERAIRSCGRVIGERHSRTLTAGAHFYRAREYEDLGDTARAQTDLARALEIFDSVILAERDADSYMNRAAVYEYMELYQNALADHASALQIDGELARPNYRRGAIFFRIGDFAQAIGEYDEAARKYPDNAYYQATRCEARAAARTDLETARAACEEAIRLDPENHYVYFSRGFLRFLDGDIEAALGDFEASIAIDDASAPAIYGRGVALTRLGRNGAADIARAAELSDTTDDFYGVGGLRL